jgi:hypothetical protein
VSVADIILKSDRYSQLLIRKEIFGQQKEQIMKQVHILLALGLILLLTACCSNPYFNEDGLKSLLKEKTGIIVEDSLTIINFEWGAAIGRDYFEEYTLKCSPKDHKNILMPEII